MPAPSFHSFDDARRYYAKELGADLRQTSDWLQAPERSGSTDWIVELTARLHRWIGTGEGMRFPAVARLAKNLNQRMQAMTQPDQQSPLLLQRDITECVGFIDQMQTQLHRSISTAHLPASDTGTTRVLTIDDDEAFTRPLLSELTRIGCAVSCCRSAAEARAWLRRQTPQLLLLNHRLPDDDGLAFCQRLAANRRLKDTAIVMLSDANGLERSAVAQAGAQACYDKSIDTLVLAAQLDDLLRQRAYLTMRHRALMVDADAAQANRLARQLRRHRFDTTVCPEPRRLFELVSTLQPAILLLSAESPGVASSKSDSRSTEAPTGGLNLCRLVRQEDRLNAVPVILLARTADARTTIKGLEAGADAVASSSIPPRMLASMMTARLERLRKLTAMADRDGLTGLWNHDYFVRQLAMEVERATRYGGQFVLAIADIDDFKRLNDTYGHLTGDRALQQVAYFLRRRFRRTDVVARYGGEEFAILLQQTTLQQSQHVLSAACNEAIDLRLPGARSAAVPLSFSMGAAEFPTHGWDADSIFQAADRVLYEAKRLGKRRVEFAPNPLLAASELAARPVPSS